MKTSPVTVQDLQRSVIAVPPLARNADLSLNEAANKTLLGHLEAGGVRNVMYGGNANFYNVGVSEYARIVDMLAGLAGADTWILPSVGPDYGKMMDQAAILRSRAFPTAMLLPMSFPYTDAGLADGVRRFTDALGKPAVVYIKSADYLAPETAARLIEEGRLVAFKYAVVRDDPAEDAYLSALLQAVDSRWVVSGIGERPAIVHYREFGLKSFTSGSVCVAPRGSMRLLHLLREGRYDEAEAVREQYLGLEDCRDSISPIRVLHDAVTLSGVADMGPMLPLLTGISSTERERVAPVARALAAWDREAATA
ncbi:dihydrodipicolinate synthase family protein [Achromobacter sp. NFACC18-2]|uniref:dihydrodipicolinate synthase family protein n=1 Tax=Achromobacter sp. NFACC18-2 TaxID=1564112 RepID=UPI0008B9DC72|nr:dihydrodipicolinate synthase family protein [Achromobacter sp. NFACC18-2]SEJ62510.1 Dihydrodipicolinate synthase/N-acetylneuraminate lyase [Achromobacter sp. NFACC18-2]